MIPNIALDDALILPHRANPRRIEFSGSTGSPELENHYTFVIHQAARRACWCSPLPAILVALDREHNNAFAAAFGAVVDRCGFTVDEIVFPPAAIAALSECIGRPPAP